MNGPLDPIVGRGVWRWWPQKHYPPFDVNFPNFCTNRSLGYFVYHVLSVREREIKDLIPYKSDYDLWRLCGETEYSFLKLVDELRPVLVAELNPRQTRTAEDWIRIRRDIAIFCVWARQYPTLKTLGEMFGLSEQRIEQIVHFYLPIFHVALCDRYIAWHDDLYWRSLEGKHYFYSYLKRF